MGLIGVSRRAPSQKPTKFLDRQTGVANDATHRECVDRIASWDCQDAHAVRHDDVLPLAKDAETRALERPDCTLMRDSGELAHT